MRELFGLCVVLAGFMFLVWRKDTKRKAKYQNWLNENGHVQGEDGY